MLTWQMLMLSRDTHDTQRICRVPHVGAWSHTAAASAHGPLGQHQPNPLYHPLSDGASAPFDADESGIGSALSLSFSRWFGSLLLPTGIVFVERGIRCGQACLVETAGVLPLARVVRTGDRRVGAWRRGLRVGDGIHVALVVPCL